jgi:hypothetical protein
MKWKEGLLDSAGCRDMTVGRYYCPSPCNVSAKMQDSRGVKEGRKRVKEFEGIDALDKRILCLPPPVQIGILRERQRHLYDKESSHDKRRT